MAGVSKEMTDLLGALDENFQLVIKNLKDGEVKEAPAPNYTLQGFWEKLGTTVKALSAESTKFCLAFSQSPAPSPKDCQPLVTGLSNSILAMVSVFYALPASEGKTLRTSIQSSLVTMVTAAQHLIEVIRTQGSFGSPAQLQSTGTVWEHCDAFSMLPQDNKTTVYKLGKSAQDLVQDALTELEEAQQEAAEEEVGEEEADEDDEPQWSAADKLLVGPTIGLVKVSHRTTKKVTEVVRKNGLCDSAANNSELDSVAQHLERVSPAVDELVSATYPPLDKETLRKQADELSSIISDLLSAAIFTHITGEADENWVKFLQDALQHNVGKLHTLLSQ